MNKKARPVFYEFILGNKHEVSGVKGQTMGV